MTFFQSINLFYYAAFVAEKPVANSGSWLWCGADLGCVTQITVRGCAVCRNVSPSSLLLRKASERCQCGIHHHHLVVTAELEGKYSD